MDKIAGFALVEIEGLLFLPLAEDVSDDFDISFMISSIFYRVFFFWRPAWGRLKN